MSFRGAQFPNHVTFDAGASDEFRQVSVLFVESYQCPKIDEFCQANAAGFAGGASDDGCHEAHRLGPHFNHIDDSVLRTLRLVNSEMFIGRRRQYYATIDRFGIASETGSHARFIGQVVLRAEGVDGVFQNQDRTVSIKASRILRLSISAAETQSHDFH